ncbi:MAG: flagellar hook capping FlgD N-terminal domain-containing protein [Nitrospinaceae bacterium]|jgi:flagellar basal-body rod modification protein FlgD|nr:flagellar hook capping FlgD N-terminal domain-containing protein [Nitrospinaceae bacterium]
MIPGVSSTSEIRYSSFETGEQIEYAPAKKMLDQDDFLKLLITQFSTQDPLDPVTDTAFISQMAEFTSLENAKETQSEISQLRQQNANQEAISMIGKQVDLVVGEDVNISGNVSEVLIDTDGPQLVVNGFPYGLDKVVAVKGKEGAADQAAQEGGQSSPRLNF